MTYKEKMTRHLQRAEELNAKVDAMEEKALGILGLSAITTSMQAYRMKQHFENDNLYRQRGNARDLHLRLATAYALAALTEANS